MASYMQIRPRPTLSGVEFAPSGPSGDEAALPFDYLLKILLRNAKSTLNQSCSCQILLGNAVLMQSGERRYIRESYRDQAPICQGSTTKYTYFRYLTLTKWC